MGYIFLIVIFSYLLVIESGLSFLRVFFPHYLSSHLNRWVKTWTRHIVALAVLFFDLRIKIDLSLPYPLPERFIIVSNHQSLIDIMAVIAALKHHTILFVSKKELGKGVPTASKVLQWQNHALIDRSYNLVQTARILRRFSKNANTTSSSIAIFPEGTRSRNGELGQFHQGAFRIAQMTVPLPTLVVAIEGGHQLSHFSSFRGRKKQVYYLKALALLPSPKNKQEIQATLEESEVLIRSQLTYWRKS